jgi:signal transduction histidine kinase
MTYPGPAELSSPSEVGQPQASNDLAFLAGGGALGALMRAHSWADTPLGEPATWPAALKTLVSVMLGASQPMFIVWGSHHIGLYNDAYIEILAEKHPSALGSPFQETWRENLRDLQPLLDRVYAGQSVHQADIKLFLRRNGNMEERHFAFGTTPIRDHTGAVVGMFGAGTEITSQALASARLEQLVRERTAELQTKEARLRTIFETSFQYQGLLTVDGLLLETNATSLEGIQARLEDVIGKPFWTTPWFARTPGMPDSVREAILQVAAGKAMRKEIVLELPTGTRVFDFSMRPVRDHSGTVIAIIPEAMELTERRSAEERLRHAQKMEAIGQLTGGVAHDFNNLLTVIQSAAGLLKRGEIDPERRERYVDAIVETVDRATTLTSQLLAFARRQTLTPVAFDVADRIRKVADMLGSLVGSRIQLVVEIACDCAYVEADISQFETAVVNMVVNARDAMNGEGVIVLRVDAHRAIPPGSQTAPALGFVAVTIADTGAGIAADEFARIFEPFYTTKAVGKGTGLGLSQAYGFARQSGGEIRVDSELGKGAAFTLYLPQIESAKQLQAAVAEPAAARCSALGDGRRVLLVEDNIEVGRFSTRMLEDMGYDTTWASTPDDALELLNDGQHAFDVVFSDVVMPGMSGVELGQAIRRLLPGLPVVLTSGYSHVLTDQGRHGFELLHKPYTPDELSHVLDRAMSHAPRRFS